MTDDLTIRNGTILDGSGGEPFAGDLAIEGGTITAVGSVPATECPEIDATGLYDVTPDWHPILGAVDGLDGLFLATGGSGHCFKLCPAIGEMVAGSVLGLKTEYADVHNFSLSRFAEGREFQSSYGGNRA